MLRVYKFYYYEKKLNKNGKKTERRIHYRPPALLRCWTRFRTCELIHIELWAAAEPPQFFSRWKVAILGFSWPINLKTSRITDRPPCKPWSRCKRWSPRYDIRSELPTDTGTSCEPKIPRHACGRIEQWCSGEIGRKEWTGGKSRCRKYFLEITKFPVNITRRNKKKLLFQSENVHWISSSGCVIANSSEIIEFWFSCLGAERTKKLSCFPNSKSWKAWQLN